MSNDIRHVINTVITHTVKNTESNRSKKSPKIRMDFATSNVGYTMFAVVKLPKTKMQTTKANR